MWHWKADLIIHIFGTSKNYLVIHILCWINIWNYYVRVVCVVYVYDWCVCGYVCMCMLCVVCVCVCVCMCGWVVCVYVCVWVMCVRCVYVYVCGWVVCDMDVCVVWMCVWYVWYGCVCVVWMCVWYGSVCGMDVLCVCVCLWTATLPWEILEIFDQWSQLRHTSGRILHHWLTLCELHFNSHSNCSSNTSHSLNPNYNIITAVQVNFICWARNLSKPSDEHNCVRRQVSLSLYPMNLHSCLLRF